jgi:hypothetical protein
MSCDMACFIRRIIRMLKQNGRTPYVEIARLTHCRFAEDWGKHAQMGNAASKPTKETSHAT